MNPKNKLAEMPVRPLLYTMAVPLMLSLLIQSLYNIVDSIFVARLSETALTAASLVYAIQFLMIAIGVGTAVGLNALLSRKLGQKKPEEACRAATTGLFLMLGTSLVFTLVGLLFSNRIATALTNDPELQQLCREYLSVNLVFCWGIFLQTYGQRILQAVGDTVLSMVSLIIVAVVNIILDPILIFGLGLGVRGAAIATVLSQAVGAVWILRFLTGKKTLLRLRRDYLRPDRTVILPVMALGISTFVMLSTESLLSISFSSSLARYGGDVAVGAMTVITSASQLCTLPIQGICQVGQPVISFNFGADKKPRVKEAFRFQLTLCGVYTCVFWLLMMLVPGAVASIFTSDSALISYTTWAMRIYMAGIFAMGFQIACQQSFMALGQAKVSLLLACLRKIILLIPLIFILPHLVAAPVFGVFLAEPVSDILAATITTITFFARFDKILDQGAARV